MVKDVNKETITSALSRHHDLLEHQFVSALDGIETTVSALKSEAAFACTSKRLREAVEHADAVLVQALSHIVENEDAPEFSDSLDEVARAEFDADAFDHVAEDEVADESCATDAVEADEVADEDAQTIDEETALESSEPADDMVSNETDTESVAVDAEPSESSESFSDVSVADGVLQHDDVSTFETLDTHQLADVAEETDAEGDNSDYGAYLGVTMQPVEY